MLKDVEKRIAHLGMRVRFDASVKKLLAEEGFDPIYGARPLRRAIVRAVEDPLSTEILEGRFLVGDCIHVTVSDGKLQFFKDAPSQSS